MKAKGSKTALLISLLYATAGALWILFSDRLLESTVDDTHLLSQLQTYKGWLFITASACVVYVLAARSCRGTPSDGTEGRTEPALAPSGSGRRFSSLAFRLMGLVLLVLVPMLIMVVLDGLKERRDLHAQAKQEARLVLRSGISHVHALIEGSRQLLLAVSHSREVRAGQFTAVDSYLADLLKLNPRYANIGITDTNGVVLASAVPPQEDVILTGHPWLERTLKRKDFVVGGYQIGPISGKPSQVMAYPLLNASGNVRFVIWVSASLEWLNELIPQTRLPPGAVLSIIDDKGTVLARSNDPHRWIGRRSPDAPLVRTILSRKEGVEEIVGLDGVQRLHAYAPVIAAGGITYLAVGIPSSVIHAPANRALTRNLITLTVAAALVLLLAWAFAEMFILRSTRALLRATRRVREGDLTARSRVAHTAGELGQLSRAFDEMAESMQKRVAERDRAEREVRESHRLLQAVVETAPSLIVLTDADGRVLQFNRACEELTGWKSEEVIGKTIADMFLTPEWVPIVRERFANLGRAEISVPMENPWRTRSGESRLIEWRCTTVPSPGGGTPLVLGTGIDITERRRSEQKITDALTFNRTIFEASPVGIITYNASGQTVSANTAIARLIGAPLEQVLSQNFRQLESWKRHGLIEAAERALANNAEVQLETEIVSTFGKRFWASCRFVPFQYEGEQHLLALFEDITHRKQAEEVIRESEERYRLLADNSEDFVSLHDTKWNQVYISPSYYRGTGWKPGEVNGTDWRARVHPKDLPHVERAREANRAGASNTIQHRVLCRDGSWIWVETHCKPILDADGTVTQLLVWSRDITARKLAEDALRLGEERMRNVIRHARCLLWSGEIEGLPGWEHSPRDGSAFVWRITIEDEEAAQKLVAFDVPPGGNYTDCWTGSRPVEDKAAADAVSTAAFIGGENGYAQEFRCVDREGKVRWLHEEVALQPVAHGRWKAFGVCTDVTERKRAEERVVRSREQLRALAARLRAVREEERTQLAREIHDHLGQLLTGLKMDLRSLQKKLPHVETEELRALLDAKASSAIELTDETISSIQKIASELRPGVLDRLGLVAGIEFEAQTFEQRTGIRSVLCLPSETMALDQDRATAMFRIFQEILTNVARHAQAKTVQIHLQQQDGRMTLRVADDGTGIDETAVSNPLSLGLLGMRERAAALGGEVQLRGERGKGTTVTVMIPLHH